jgi:hypothetical protein
VLVAGVLVLDVADVIRTRLGEPTVTALARRFSPAGRCLTCGERFGAAPLSVRAYRDHTGIITLVAYHAACAASAWVDVGPDTLQRQETWSAAVTSVSLPLAARRWFRRLRGPGTRDQIMPIMLVHPSLEMTRVRQAGFGEAVSVDGERYGRLGFADPTKFARAYPLRPTGQAWIAPARGIVRLHVMTADRTWSAPIPQLAAVLAVARGGVLVGVACDRDADRLAAETSYLAYTIANGDVLLGWAPLPDGHDEDRHWALGASARLSLQGAAWRRHRTGAGPPRPWPGG